MVQEFLHLNKRKVFSALKISLLAFNVMYFILLIVFYFAEKEPSPITELVLYWLLIAIGIPLLIVVLATGAWIVNKLKRNRLYNNPPFQKLEDIYFEDFLKNEHTNSFFTETIKAGYIDNFLVKVDFKENDHKKVTIATYAIFPKINAEKEDRLKRKNIHLNITSVVKEYKVKELKKLSNSALNNELLNFTRILKIEGFTPITSKVS